MDFWNFELYNVGCNMLDESLRMTIISGFIEHPAPSKILSNTNIKCWIIYWVHLRRPLYSKFCYIFGSSHHMLSLRVYFQNRYETFIKVEWALLGNYCIFNCFCLDCKKLNAWRFARVFIKLWLSDLHFSLQMFQNSCRVLSPISEFELLVVRLYFESVIQ